MRIFLWLLAVLGGLFLLLLVALVGFGFIGFKKGFDLAKGAVAFSDETIAAYGAAWDETALLDRAAPELLAELSKTPGALDQLSLLVDAQAGRFQSAEPATCDDFKYSATTADGEVFTAQCSAKGEVEKGAAQFSLAVVHRHDEWKLLGFFVSITPNATEDSSGSTLVNFTAEPNAPADVFRAAFNSGAVSLSLQAPAISYETASGARAFVGVGAEAMR